MEKLSNCQVFLLDIKEALKKLDCKKGVTLSDLFKYVKRNVDCEIGKLKIGLLEALESGINSGLITKQGRYRYALKKTAFDEIVKICGTCGGKAKKTRQRRTRKKRKCIAVRFCPFTGRRRRSTRCRSKVRRRRGSPAIMKCLNKYVRQKRMSCKKIKRRRKTACQARGLRHARSKSKMIEPSQETEHHKLIAYS